ncbi:MAG: serine/threonine-protein kinase [Rubrivivax sp.]|nr:serine/threonine-protein kinase [Rubrivivax sp.]
MSSEAPRLHNEIPNALPLGTRLGEFELRGVLGIGGFGIVYLAFDHALEREVAVKEYMPASLAGRTEALQVSVRSQSDAETFALGLKSFVNEARLLARFDHPSLLKVHRFWEANGTAYMAMPVMRGRTAKEARLAMSAPPTEAWLRALLEPLLGAIEKLHSEGVYHRDIAPDNIQIEPGGHPVLLDFGAARRVIGDKSQTLTAILKPAYAPIEQYAEAGSVKQGPWTDIYALGATLHFLLLARPPAPATARAVQDEASALTTQALPGCSETFLRTVDWMLAPRPSDRPQSVAALRDALDGRTQPALRRAGEHFEPSQWDRTVVLPPASVTLPATPRPARISPAPLAEPHIAAPPVAASLAAPPAPAGRFKWLPLGLGLGAVAVAVSAVALWARPPVAAVMTAQPAASAAGLAAAAAPAPVVASPVTTSVPESAVATVVVPTPTPTPAAKPKAAVGAAATRPVAAGGNARRLPRAETAMAAPAAAAQPEPPRLPQEAPAQPSRPPATASAATPVLSSAAEPAKPVAAGPEAKCAGRNAFMRFVCIERECLRPELQSHPDCLNWRKEAKRE